MYKLVTAEMMRKLDQITIEDFGLSSLKLMTKAGSEVFKAIEKQEVGLKNKIITIVCGKGNNGGDGLVVAECLLAKGINPNLVVLSAKTSLGGDPKKIYSRIIKKYPEFKVQFISKYKESILKGAQIIVDAIFGTGFNSNPEGVFFDMIQGMNESEAKVYSIDMPSGIHGSSGNMEDIAVKADATITLGYPKLGLYLSDGYTYSGEVVVADIGIPKEVDEEVQETRVLIEEADLKNLFRKRTVVCEKKDFGKVFSFAGSLSMPGAAILSSLAALRTGAGLLKLGVPMNISASISSVHPEIMTQPLAYTQPGFSSGNAEREILRGIKWADVVLMGPGLSVQPETKKLVKKVLSKPLLKPVVLDADALNTLSESPELLGHSQGLTVLTPHNGEMARLGKTSKELFMLNRIDTIIKKSIEWECYIVLKGTPTIIACPDGSAHIFVNKCPALATGGTGDVLAGIITSLIGQKYEVLTSIKIALYLHKIATDFAVLETGEDSLLPSDIIKYLPKAIMKIKDL